MGYAEVEWLRRSLENMEHWIPTGRTSKQIQFTQEKDKETRTVATHTMAEGKCGRVNAALAYVCGHIRRPTTVTLKISADGKIAAQKAVSLEATAIRPGSDGKARNGPAKLIGYVNISRVYPCTEGQDLGVAGIGESSTARFPELKEYEIDTIIEAIGSAEDDNVLVADRSILFRKSFELSMDISSGSAIDSAPDSNYPKIIIVYTFDEGDA